MAFNTIGDSALSVAGNGGLISYVVIPDAPKNLRRDSTTTTSQIGILWDLGTSNGGSAVIDYRVSFD